MTAALPAYFEVADAPGLKLFRCSTLRATLTTTACATNFRRAHRIREGEIASCQACAACELGALHAGVDFKRRSGLYGKSICSRCGKYADRIINGTRCVSCYNREREWVVGANAKGTPPTMAPLVQARLGVNIDGKPMVLRSDKARGSLELVITVLRFGEGRTLFHRPRRGPAVAIGDWVKEQRCRLASDQSAKRARGEAAARRRRRELVAAMAAE